MQASLIRKTEQFLENRRRTERVFRLASPLTHCLCSLLLCLNDCDVDLDALQRAKRALEKGTSPFSLFRGIGKAPIAAKLSCVPNAEEWIGHAKETLAALRKHGFAATDYLCLAALLMAKRYEEREELAARAHACYLEMKRAHRILTAGEDACFAVLFAMYANEGDSINSSAEAAFSLLKTQFGSTNAAQMASHVIGLVGGDAEHLAVDTANLYLAIRENGVKNRSRTDLSVLAVLAALGKTDAATVSAIVELDAYLKAQKGHSAIILGRDQRLTLAASLVAMDACLAAPDAPKYAVLRDALQCSMLVTITLAVIQNMAATSV